MVIIVDSKPPFLMLSPDHIPGQSTNTLYQIGEAADVLGISVQTLRYYEAEGLIIPFHRQSKHRRYSVSDLERVRCMRSMINDEKVSIEGIKRLLALIPCWRLKGCSAESKAACAAATDHTTPCWMVSEKSKECKNAECRLCPVYSEITDCHILKQIIGGGPVPGSMLAGEDRANRSGAGEIPPDH